jgi:hypothetical protein
MASKRKRGVMAVSAAKSVEIMAKKAAAAISNENECAQHEESLAYMAKLAKAKRRNRK